jgi:hypothetical protein
MLAACAGWLFWLSWMLMLSILFVMLNMLSGNVCYIKCLCWLPILDKYCLVMLSGYADISGWLFYLVLLAGYAGWQLSLCCMSLLVMLAALIYWLSWLTGFAGCLVILAALFCWLC